MSLRLFHAQNQIGADKMKPKHTTPFTQIPNEIIRHSGLNVYQKLTYIALYSYAGAKKTCFPSYQTLATAVGCSKRKVISTIGELEDMGLISKRQNSKKSGGAASNEYEIVAAVAQQTPVVAADSPPDVADGASPVAPNSPKEYSPKNKNISKNNHPSICAIDEIETYRELIRESISYDILVETHGENRVDEVVELMLDTICSGAEAVRIGGCDYPHAIVKSRLLKLDFQHIEYVFECLNRNTTKVRNIKNYLLTALYNAPTTIGSYYRAEVNHDWGNA